MHARPPGSGGGLPLRQCQIPNGSEDPKDGTAARAVLNVRHTSGTYLRHSVPGTRGAWNGADPPSSTATSTAHSSRVVTVHHLSVGRAHSASVLRRLASRNLQLAWGAYASRATSSAFRTLHSSSAFSLYTFTTDYRYRHWPVGRLMTMRRDRVIQWHSTSNGTPHPVALHDGIHHSDGQPQTSAVRDEGYAAPPQRELRFTSSPSLSMAGTQPMFAMGTSITGRYAALSLRSIAGLFISNFEKPSFPHPYLISTRAPCAGRQLILFHGSGHRICTFNFALSSSLVSAHFSRPRGRKEFSYLQIRSYSRSTPNATHHHTHTHSPDRGRWTPRAL